MVPEAPGQSRITRGLANENGPVGDQCQPCQPRPHQTILVRISPDTARPTEILHDASQPLHAVKQLMPGEESRSSYANPTASSPSQTPAARMNTGLVHSNLKHCFAFLATAEGAKTRIDSHSSLKSSRSTTTERQETKMLGDFSRCDTPLPMSSASAFAIHSAACRASGAHSWDVPPSLEHKLKASRLCSSDTRNSQGEDRVAHLTSFLLISHGTIGTTPQAEPGPGSEQFPPCSWKRLPAIRHPLKSPVTNGGTCHAVFVPASKRSSGIEQFFGRSTPPLMTNLLCCTKKVSHH